MLTVISMSGTMGAKVAYRGDSGHWGVAYGETEPQRQVPCWSGHNGKQFRLLVMYLETVLNHPVLDLSDASFRTTQRVPQWLLTEKSVWRPAGRQRSGESAVHVSGWLRLWAAHAARTVADLGLLCASKVVKPPSVDLAHSSATASGFGHARNVDLQFLAFTVHLPAWYMVLTLQVPIYVHLWLPVGLTPAASGTNLLRRFESVLQFLISVRLLWKDRPSPVAFGMYQP